MWTAFQLFPTQDHNFTGKDFYIRFFVYLLFQGFDDGVHELFNNVDNDKESHNGTTFNDDVSSSSTTLPQNHLPTTKIKEHRDTQHPNANDIQSGIFY